MFLLSDVTTGTNLRGRGSFRAVNVTRMPQVVAFRLLWMGSFDSRWAALVPHPRLCRLIRWPMRTAFLSIGAHFRRQRPPHGRVTIHRHHQLLIHRLAPPNWWNHFFPFRLSPLPPSPLISLNGNWTPVRHKTVRFVPNSFFDDCEVVTVWWRGVSNRRWQRDAPVCDQHRRQFANKVNCRCGRPRSWWHTVGRRNRFGAVASIDTHTHALTLLDGRTLSHRPQSAPNPERFKHNAVKIAPNRTSAGGQTDQVGWNSSTISLMCSG